MIKLFKNYYLKKLLLISTLLFSPAIAQTEPKTVEPHIYRPFRYETKCAIETKEQFVEDTCVVIETREKSGALRTRNVFSNRFSLTIKGRFDKEKGYMTWDSHNKHEYKWEYKVGGTDWTYIMPGFLLQNVSWD